jgi:DNA-binding PadR family transcriptional regulator
MGNTTQQTVVAQLSAFQRDILRAIVRADDHPNGDRPYGQSIQTWLEGHYGSINHGRLYPNLDDLKDRGLIRVGEIDKRTNGYALTDDGAAVVQELKHRYTDAYNLRDEASR